MSQSDAHQTPCQHMVVEDGVKKERKPARRGSLESQRETIGNMPGDFGRHCIIQCTVDKVRGDKYHLTVDTHGVDRIS